MVFFYWMYTQKPRIFPEYQLYNNYITEIKFRTAVFSKSSKISILFCMEPKLEFVYIFYSLVETARTFYMLRACLQGKFFIKPKKFRKLPVVNFRVKLQFLLFKLKSKIVAVSLPITLFSHFDFPNTHLMQSPLPK